MSPPSEYSGSDLPMHTEKDAPRKTPFYKRKKFWIICAIITIVIIAIVVPVVLLVAFPQIAQMTVNGSSLSFSDVNITFPKFDASKRDVVANQNNSFTMSMSGGLGNTGPLGATISFPTPISVTWNNILLGSLSLPPVSVAGGSGSIVASTTFIISDTDAFGNFSEFMLSQDSFTWVMTGQVTVNALGRTVNGLNLYKEVTLNGMGGFTQAKILEFSLPSDDPNGGIDMSILTSLYNPSPLGVQLGAIQLNINYGSTFVGPVSASGVFLSSGPNNITLTGKMVKQTNPTDLANISELMSRYIAGLPSNTSAVGVSAAPDGTHPVGWLSEGFKSVTLHVALQTTTQLQLITGISLGDLDFGFTAQAPYAPTIASNGVSANFKMPFGFSINITQVEQNMTIATNQDGPIASLQSTWGNATSNAGLGLLNFNIGSSPLTVFADKHQAFNLFDANLTLSKGLNFSVVGSATVGASTSIGNVILSNIPFNASTGLQGLQGLNSTPTLIYSLDVVSGTTDHLNLAISVGMSNPSTLQIGTGDVTFDMVYEGSILGTVLLPNFILQRGANTVNATSAFSPNTSPQGKQLLTYFVGGNDTVVQIAGSNSTTAVASLLLGLSQINLTSTLPGLKSKLITNASLVVLPDTLTTKVAHAAVVIANPFTAPLVITKVTSTISYNGMPVGSISQDISSNPIAVAGKSSAISPPLSLVMNLEPASIALLLYETAKNAAGISSDQLKALSGLLNLGGLKVGDSSVVPSSSLFTNFNLPQFVQTALANLPIDLALESTVEIGQYVTDLQYSQTSIACTTDSTVDYLIPVVGQPIVQAIVDGSSLVFNNVVIWNPTTSSFNTWLTGAITGTGPMSAEIAFPTGVTVSWNGRMLGQLAMPTISAAADKGAAINLNATFSVGDASAMAAFSTALMSEASFDWDITASGVSVTALNFTFTGITMKKTVTLKGMKGISAVVQSYKLPANDPAGGITLQIQTLLNNPSNVGISLNVLSFNSFFTDSAGSHLLGPLAGSQVIIPPNSNTQLQLVGRLIPQTNPSDLAAVQTIFDNYLAGHSTAVSVVGTGAQGATGDVPWLSTAFKSLTLQTSLPGGTNVQIIHGIEITNMAFDFTCGTCAYAPLVSSNNGIIANFSLPADFGFPIDITSLEQTINVSAIVAPGQSDPLALLVLPWNSAQTSGQVLTTSISNAEFAVYPPSYGLFNKFTYALTVAPPSQIPPLGFQGVANSKASTAVGTLTLDGIAFNLDVAIGSTLGSLNDFGGAVSLSNVNVIGSHGSDYIIIDLDTQINNPSQVTISTGNVNFEVDYMGVNLGQVYLNNLVIKPGQNTVPSEFHLTPGANPSAAAQAAAVAMLSSYMGGGVSNLTIKNGVSTIPSLQGALAAVVLQTSLTGLSNARLVQSATTDVDLSTINIAGILESLATLGNIGNETATVYAYVNFVIANPLKAPFTIASMNAAVTVKDFPTAGQSLLLSEFQVNLVSLGEPLYVAGGSTGTLKAPIKVPIVASLAQLVEIIIAKGSLFSSFNLPVTITLSPQGTGLLVDQFPAAIFYSEDNVPNTVSVTLTAPGNAVLTNSSYSSAIQSALASVTPSLSAVLNATSTAAAATSTSTGSAVAASSATGTGTTTAGSLTTTTGAPAQTKTSTTLPTTSAADPETTAAGTTTTAATTTTPATTTTSSASTPTSTNWWDAAVGWLGSLIP